MAARCTHLDQIHEFSRQTDGCEECLLLGDTWVHLRQCLISNTSIRRVLATENTSSRMPGVPLNPRLCHDYKKPPHDASGEWELEIVERSRRSADCEGFTVLPHR